MAVVELTRVSTCIWLLLQLLVWSVVGDYEMSVTVHSFLLLESRCALCYGLDSTTPQLTMSCCDEVLDTPCRTADCDIKLRFCPISEGLGFDADELSTPSSSPVQCVNDFKDGFLGYNIPSGQTVRYDGASVFGDDGIGLANPVTYTGDGGWEGAELTILVYDRDHAEHGDFDDVVDVYQISVEINPGSSTGQTTYTGRYNYTRLELEIKVICVQEENIDENCFRDSCQLNMINCNQGQCINDASGARCECMPGFTGEFCTEADKCATNDCQNGTCISESDDYRCSCFPGYSGVLCDVNIDDCAPESCNNRGGCVDEVQNFSCVCFPGFTGEQCEIVLENTPESGSTVIAIIAGGVAGGVVVILLTSVIILILVFVAASRVRRSRIKRYNVQGNSYNDVDHGSPVPVLSTGSDDVHIYDVATTTAGTNSNTSATPGEYQTIKNFINPLYTDNSITEIAAVPTPEYDSPVSTQPSGSCSAEQEEEEERNVVNLIYNDDGVPTAQGTVVEYDRIGNVYHTLENEQDRAERYILIARAMSTESESASGDSPDSSKEHSKKPPHSYEDVPL